MKIEIMIERIREIVRGDDKKMKIEMKMIM